MLEIIQLSKTYKPQEVLKDINLTVPKGFIQGLIGKNGSGKSTLLNAIAGVIQYEGTVKIDGEVIVPQRNDYRKKVGYVLQKPFYIEKLSATEYLSFVAEMYGISKKVYAPKIAELLNFFSLPKHNSKWIEDYSKGMKAKVSLATALLHDPEYFILDEPFDGMDFMSVENCVQLFKNKAEAGACILIASHQFDVITELCHSIALLQNKTIALNHSYAELQALAKQDNQHLKAWLAKK